MTWRQRFDGRPWRLTPEGVVTLQDGAERSWRTPGAPRTMRTYLAAWRDELLDAVEQERVPLALLLMTVATENGPASIEGTLVRHPYRKEPGYVSDGETPSRISVGPCHPLISTAREVMGDPSIDRLWLSVVGNNLRTAARYIRKSWDRHDGDPILVAAVYNAGSIRRSSENPWRLRSHGNHLDRAASWYGDACAAILEAHDLVTLDRSGLGRADHSNPENP